MIADGFTAKTTGGNSVFIGSGSRANSNGEDNQIVIGASAIGAGANSVVLGNNSITKTILKGNVGFGESSPSQKIDVVGTLRVRDGNQANGKVFTSDANGVGSWQTPSGGADSTIYATKYRLDTTRTRINTDLNGKENAFSKGSIIEGSGVSISGTLSNRLVGSGDITISATGSAGYVQWSDTTAGQLTTKYRIDTMRTRINGDLNGKVPMGRQLTINGTTYDLSSNRSWTISGADSTIYATKYRVDTAKTAIRAEIAAKGNETITLSGDVTGSGTTSISTVIPSSTITYAKMQGVTGSKLLGRYNSFSGTVQEVGLGSGLSFDTASGTLSATGGGGSPTLTEKYIGFGSGSNLLTGDSSLKYEQTPSYSLLSLKPSSGNPYLRVQRGSYYGDLVIPSSNISYTGTDFKDMTVVYGSSPGLGLISDDNGIKINSTGLS